MRAALVAIAVLSACASSTAAGPSPAEAPPQAAQSLYSRLGGRAAIEAVVDDFLGRVAQDERLNASFAGAHLPRLKQRLVEQVCQAGQGPCTYSGRDMKVVHQGLGITGAQFDALVGHLVASLDHFKVPAQEKSELLSVLGPMRGVIVEEP